MDEWRTFKFKCHECNGVYRIIFHDNYAEPEKCPYCGNEVWDVEEEFGGLDSGY